MQGEAGVLQWARDKWKLTPRFEVLKTSPRLQDLKGKAEGPAADASPLPVAGDFSETIEIGATRIEAPDLTPPHGLIVSLACVEGPGA